LLGFEISSTYKYRVTIEICLQLINLSIEMCMSESKALARTLFELQRSIFLPCDHGRIYIYGPEGTGAMLSLQVRNIN